MQNIDNELFITEPLSERTYKKLEKIGIRKSKAENKSPLKKGILVTK